jgi:uncharacterized protein YegL
MMQSAVLKAPLPAITSKSFEDDDALEQLAAAPEVVAEPDPECSSEEGVLKLGTRVEYTSIARNKTQDVFGLLTLEAMEAELEPAKESAEERQPTDIVCALDVSGSMSGDKIRHLQEAVRFIISQATPQDRLSLVAFNSQATRVLNLRRMTLEGQNEANLAVLRLVAGGGTSIAAGLDVALQVLEQRRQRNKVSAVLLLTDGQDHSTRARLPQLLARAARACSGVYAFGFGKDHDAALLGELSEQAHTPFTFVEDTECIREAFAGAVGGLSSVVAQQVELVLHCRHALKALHTPFAVTRTGTAEGERVTVTIPDLFAGERRDVLVELAVPEAAGVDSGALVLLDAQLRYKNLKTGKLVQSQWQSMQAEQVAVEQPEAEPDEEVSAQRERVQVTAALQEAASWGDRGDFAEAQRLLQSAEQGLIEKSRKRPAAKASKMREALGLELADAQQRMASRSSWECGGRAELKDAVQMYSVQRCTNTYASAQAPAKRSKALFASKKQCAMIEKAVTVR